MAVNLGEFHPDVPAVEDLLRDPEGPVGDFIGELSRRAAGVARTVVHVFPGTPRSTIWNRRTSTAILPPGYTLESIRTHWPQIGTRGGMFGGVDATGLPSVFLEYRPNGAEQMVSRYPFLTTGLESLEGTF